MSNAVFNSLELFLYVNLLISLKKISKAIEVLEGELGNLMKVKSERLARLVKLYSMQKNWIKVCELCENLLNERYMYTPRFISG